MSKLRSSQTVNRIHEHYERAYKSKQGRSFRVVLKHIHVAAIPDVIKKEIEDLGHTDTNIWNIKEQGIKKALYMFCVELKPKNNNKDIYDDSSLLQCRVKVELPYPKRVIPQCINCQRYGHIKSFCYYKARYVEYAEDHSSINCIRRKKSKDVKCVLCEGNHPANYKDSL
jgi:hypothetical protein